MVSAAGRPEVLVVGDVINDVIVLPSGPPRPGTDTASLVEMRFGGSGANQAAWMGALGASVRFAGRAGAADAEAHRRALECFGVEAVVEVDESRPTGTIVIVVGPAGERSMFTDRGASEWLSGVDLQGRLLDGVRLLHLSGYQLFGSGGREAVLGLWAAAGEAGVTRSVDPCSAAGLSAVGQAAWLGWTEGASIAFPNLDEAEQLVGERDPDLTLDALLGIYPTVAVTLGPAGAVVGSRDGERVRVPGHADVVDPTGAGDAFCAGFLAAWLRAAPLRECAEAGSAASARAIAVVGGRPPAGLVRRAPAPAATKC